MARVYSSYSFSYRAFPPLGLWSNKVMMNESSPKSGHVRVVLFSHNSSRWNHSIRPTDDDSESTWSRRTLVPRIPFRAGSWRFSSMWGLLVASASMKEVWILQKGREQYAGDFSCNEIIAIVHTTGLLGDRIASNGHGSASCFNNSVR